mmetsp:Transcript_10631/g.10705  ORF Transcript_10631/g.10705 Transcript_10631/m.10705 type:complete len:175 (+) Transcript_10631:62-586(+)
MGFKDIFIAGMLLFHSAGAFVSFSTVTRKPLGSLQMSNSDISNAFFKGGLIPLCLEDVKVDDDPTAGMTPDEVTNYISNVGGGLCGYPEYVREFIGLALNLSLTTFGLLTIIYIIYGGLNFIVEKQTDGMVEGLKMDRPKPSFTGIDPSGSDNSEPSGPNRSERRLRQKYGDDK